MFDSTMNTIGSKSVSGDRKRTQPLRAISLCRLKLSRKACNEIISFINWIDLRLTRNRRLPEKTPKLRHLEQELQGVESLDGKPESMLRQATDGIPMALPNEDIECRRTPPGLNDFVAKFEKSHPELYAVFN